MKSYLDMSKADILKILLNTTKALEELEPHFSQRREIKEIEEAISKLTP